MQGFWYFRGRKITENHGNRPTLKITEITENHGKSRNQKLKFLLFAIVVPGCHGKSRKITETEMKVPIVCYCCSWRRWMELVWARTCVRPVSPCFAMVMLKNGSPNGSRPPPNVLCFVSSLVGVQVRQRRCIRSFFVPRRHHRKSRKYHGNATENHGKSRKITENHGKSRKITEGFFQANHGNSRSPVLCVCVCVCLCLCVCVCVCVSVFVCVCVTSYPAVFPPPVHTPPYDAGWS